MQDIGINIRKATDSDNVLLFQWRNAEETRKMSFSSDEIDWENHCRWFEEIMSNPDREIYIGETIPEHIPFGELRFDILMGKVAKISIIISPDWRRKGLGMKLIQQGIPKFCCQHTEIGIIIALIKPDNIASIKLFEKCGFSYRERYCLDSTQYSEKWILEVK